MKVSGFLSSLAIFSVVSFSNPALAANVTSLGNLNVAPAVDQALVQFGGLYLPDVFTFSLSSNSNVYVDFDSVLGFSLGSKFSLYDSTGTTQLQSFNMPTVTVLGGPELTFSNLLAGSYQFKYNPGLFTVNVGTQVTFSATAVPEPETNALMLVGLGMIGLIARRKFS